MNWMYGMYGGIPQTIENLREMARRRKQIEKVETTIRGLEMELNKRDVSERDYDTGHTERARRKTREEAENLRKQYSKFPDDYIAFFWGFLFVFAVVGHFVAYYVCKYLNLDSEGIKNAFAAVSIGMAGIGLFLALWLRKLSFLCFGIESAPRPGCWCWTCVLLFHGVIANVLFLVVDMRTFVPNIGLIPVAVWALLVLIVTPIWGRSFRMKRSRATSRQKKNSENQIRKASAADRKQAAAFKSDYNNSVARRKALYGPLLQKAKADLTVLQQNYEPYVQAFGMEKESSHYIERVIEKIVDRSAYGVVDARAIVDRESREAIAQYYAREQREWLSQMMQGLENSYRKSAEANRERASAVRDLDKSVHDLDKSVQDLYDFYRRQCGY